MDMKIKKKNYVSAIFCLLCFVMCIISGAFAATVNAEGTASLTLNCVRDGEVISGMEWQIYHVAEDLSGEKPKLTAAFNKYRRQISIGDGSVSAMSQLASTLKGYTVQGRIKPTQTAFSDDNGKVAFTGLEQGYYLVSAQKFTQNHVTWEAEPLMVVLSEEDNYQMNAFPKMNYATLDASEVEFTVRKIWENDEHQPQARATYITAEIYKDDEFDHQIRLDESNDWTYSWTGNPASEWVVVEQEIPKDYTVIYRKQGVEYVIVNTYEPGGASSWWEDEGEETTSHETGNQGEWTETTTTKPSGQMTSDLETTTTDGKTIHSEQTSTNTTSVTEASAVSSGSSTSATTTTTTVTTTRTPGSGSGNGSSNSGGSSSSSRYSSGSRSSGNGSGSQSGSNNAAKIEKLPQTGQLWWPVVPLAVGGVLLISTGLKLKEKDHSA
ncbi:MAG: Cna B-type domain-containing protein [Oscillospiraceae bacterium]|nr:Cna B-type domain-containing protein [Oscillospiraceae bacterium]